MEIQKSDLVRSLAGRDRGELFFVIDVEGDFALIADGKIRRLEKPKRKRLKHLRYAGTSDCRTAERIRRGGKVTNNEIRRALAEVENLPDGAEGGM